ncbi:MAG TPA: fasciclin domain-containing protein [Oculatellaceae cyanobacterium]
MRSVTWLAAVPLALCLGASSMQVEAKTHHHKKHGSCCTSTCSRKGKNIVQTACADGSFKTLVSNLKAAGLTKTLEGKGPFTVFAPDDAAFAKLPKNNNLSGDKDKLAKTLKYHVVAKKLMASDLTAMRSVPTLEGESLMLNSKDGKEIVDGAMVTKADIVCNNGVIHVIDTVLSPERGK